MYGGGGGSTLFSAVRVRLYEPNVLLHHSHELGIDKPLRLVIPTQDFRDGHRRIQLAAVGYTLIGSRSGAAVVELLKVHAGRIVVAIPLLPSLLVDDITKLAVLENDASVRMPRTPQVGSSIARAKHASFVNDVLGQIRAIEVAVGGDGTVSNRLEIAGLEPHLRKLTEDEIDSPTDVRLSIKLAAGIGVQRILKKLKS